MRKSCLWLLLRLTSYFAECGQLLSPAVTVDGADAGDDARRQGRDLVLLRVFAEALERVVALESALGRGLGLGLRSHARAAHAGNETRRIGVGHGLEKKKRG